jgi:hypothetical protein
MVDHSVRASWARSVTTTSAPAARSAFP